MKQLFLLLLLLCCTGCAAIAPASEPSQTPEIVPPAAGEEFSAETEPSAETDASTQEDTPPAAIVPADDTLVEVGKYLPEVFVELRYAGENNFTGQRIYPFTSAYLRYGTVKKLGNAAVLLREQGYALLIWDAFRPAAAQFALWEVCSDPVYVSDPNRGYSSHTRGNTVDVTLVTTAGEPVEMPTEFDDFTPLADRDYSDVGTAAAANAQLLEDTMIACGFKPYQGEWWHFSDETAYEPEANFTPPTE